MAAFDGRALVLAAALWLAVLALRRTRPRHVHALIPCSGPCQRMRDGHFRSLAHLRAERPGWTCRECTDTLTRLDQEARP